MTSPLVGNMIRNSLHVGLRSHVWASDLIDGCRVKNQASRSTPTKNIITHTDIRHVSGSGVHVERNADGAGRDRLWFGPGQALNIIPANAPGASNDTGKTVQLGLKVITEDGASKSLSVGQSSPGYVARSVTATSFATIGSTANLTASWVFNGAITTLIRDAGNPKDWYAISGGPATFRVIVSSGATVAADVSFTATAADNLVAEIAAQLVTLLNAALNTRNGTSGVAYAAYSSGTNALTITNSSVSGNPALALGAYTLTCTVRDASAVEITDQFHAFSHQSASPTAQLSVRMPPDFKLLAVDLQVYRDTDLTASTLPDYATESRDGHLFANYGFTDALTTGGSGKYLDNDAGTARSYLAVAGDYDEITVQVIVEQMERSVSTKYLVTAVTDDELQATSQSTFAIGSYSSNELFVSPGQSSAWETGLFELYDRGPHILTFTISVSPVDGQSYRMLHVDEAPLLRDYSSADWTGMNIKGLWLAAGTGTILYDPTTGTKMRVFGAKVWDRALTAPERNRAIALARAECLERGISLGTIVDAITSAAADSLTAWRLVPTGGAWPFRLWGDLTFSPRLMVFNPANGGSGYAINGGVGGEINDNALREDFVSVEDREVIPIIRALNQMRTAPMVFTAEGTNNKEDLVNYGVPAYETGAYLPTIAKLRAQGDFPIAAHATIARGGNITFETPRQDWNDRKAALAAAGTITTFLDITSYLIDDQTEATRAQTTGSIYFSSDGIHLLGPGQDIRKDLAATAINTYLRIPSYALREDGGFALREDGGYALREA
jgi:hypothetical protein